VLEVLDEEAREAARGEELVERCVGVDIVGARQ